MPTFGSLFAGIGGIDLGFERAGFQCKWQVEHDPYALQVLEKHWPNTARYRDVRYFLGSKRWRRVRTAWDVDVIAGGFPCQDISNAGKRAGIGGSRSGLWSEFARIVRLLRPRHVVVENVPALTIRGMDRVLGDLAELGFDCEWDRIPAAAVGAPHLRWRIFILAHAQGVQREAIKWSEPHRTGQLLATDPDSYRRREGREADTAKGKRGREPRGSVVCTDVSDSDSQRCEEQHVPALAARAGQHHRSALPDAASRWSGQLWREQFAAYCESQRNLFWADAQPPVCGVVDGVPHRVDRLRGLGNAVVPQVIEWIARRLMAVIQERTA